MKGETEMFPEVQEEPFCPTCGGGLAEHVLVEDEDQYGQERAGYACGFRCESCQEIYPFEDKMGDKNGYFCEDCWEESNDYNPDDPWFEENGYLPDGTRFADPGGNSALRAAGPDNPRNLPCPSCGEENRRRRQIGCGATSATPAPTLQKGVTDDR